MYTPSFSVSLNSLPSSLQRTAIQGAAHSGKTWATTTFPNLTVGDIDNKMGAHRHRTDINILPFHNDTRLEALAKEIKVPFRDGGVVNRFNIIYAYLEKELKKFTPDQTISIDSWTMLMNSLEGWIAATPVCSKKDGDVDKFEFWARKAKLVKYFLEMLKTADCNIIVTFHESKDMNAEGIPTGKLNPLMSGSMKEQLGQHFTDWYRQTAESKKDAAGKPTGETEYFWQIRPDSECNCCCSIKHLIDSKKLKIPATYQSLVEV